VPLGWLVSFCVLTCPSLCGLQKVSAPYSVGFFLYPDMSLPLLSPEGKCPSLGWFLSVSWLYSSVCLLQGVSTPSICLSIFGVLMSSFLPTFLRRWAFLLYLLVFSLALLCLCAPQILISKLQSFNSNVLLLHFLI